VLGKVGNGSKPARNCAQWSSGLSAPSFSTLMKVLSGVYPSGTYSGDIYYQGQLRHFRGIADSEKVGIIIIHQELALVPLLSITENLFLGNEQASVIDWNTAEVRTQALLEKVGLKENPQTLITNLGVGKQQLIEIAKALSKEVKLLILDEPTASLNENDSDALLALLREFKDHGITSILISHKLNEVRRVADRITILRDGATIETLEPHEISEDRIVTSMVGRKLVDRYPKRTPRIGETIFEVRDWVVYHPLYVDRQVIKGINLSISSEMPELLGICDRIYVMNDGKLISEMLAKDASQEKIMRAILRADIEAQ
jgi:putative multiple sugar transport system ATP-binding protein